VELIVTALSGSFVAMVLHLRELIEFRQQWRRSDTRRR